MGIRDFIDRRARTPGGNAIKIEVGQQIAILADDATEPSLSKYGKPSLPVLYTHGADDTGLLVWERGTLYMTDGELAKLAAVIPAGGRAVVTVEQTESQRCDYKTGEALFREDGTPNMEKSLHFSVEVAEGDEKAHLWSIPHRPVAAVLAKGFRRPG